jgi:D-inositol-3-phosphate glycosyltransferase
MRIALISEHASPLAAAGGVDAGGQNVYVNHVARALASTGHQVDVLTRRDEPSCRPVVHVRPGMRVLHIPAGPAGFVPKERLLPYMADFGRHAEGIARASGSYDLVHANFFMSGLAALRIRRALGVPFVITLHALGLVRRLHQGSADGFPSDRTAIERELIHSADRVIAECPQDRNDLINLYGAEERRLVTVPCGYDPDEFGPGDRRRARAALGLPADEYIILQLGRIVPRKGIDNVIRALAMLRQQSAINARLLVVGGEADTPCETATPEIGRLRALAAELNVADRVIFTGRRARTALRDYYSAADVFVTTPWYEPFGITPLEAMACGTPVIGANVGGIKYTVLDRVTGFLIGPRDPQTLATRFAQLAVNPALGRAMGRAGMHRARSQFTWASVTNQLAEVYAEVAALHQRPVVRARLRALPGLTEANS